MPRITEMLSPLPQFVASQDSVLVAGGIDVLIPMYVANEWTKFGAGELVKGHKSGKRFCSFG